MKLSRFTDNQKIKQFFLYSFFALLFLSSIFIMFFKLDSYPQGLYNWENYSVWRIFQREHEELQPPMNNYFSLTQGLMTDSGLSPFIGIPVGFMFDNAGANLFTLRVWNAFLGVMTIALFFFLIKKLFGSTVAAFSSAYLLFAPAFILYIRTGTNVGISLFFSLITFYLLYLVWRYPHRIINYVFLALSLWINSYLYGPIRFFLILSLILIAGRLLYVTKQSLKINVQKVGLLLLIGLIGFLFLKNPVTLYFHGRGEQILTKYAEDPTLQEKGITSVIPIITDNAMDLGKLYLNIDTKPAVTDYWNPQGQLIATFLVPLFLFGLVISLIRIRSPQYFLLLLWLLITSLPIIFTNNVHIGRLIFTLPPLFILVGIGCAQLFRYAAKVFPYTKILYLIAGSIIVVSVYFEVSPYFSKNLPVDNYVSRDVLKELEMGNTDLYLFNVNYESLRFWTAYFYLHNDYRFVDLQNPEREHTGNKDANFNIYFIEEGAIQEDLIKFCEEQSYPIILTGYVDPALLTLPCRNRIIQI